MIYLCSVYSIGANAKLMKQRYEYAMKRTAEFLQTGVCVFSPIVHCHELALRHNLPKEFKFWAKLDYDYIDAASEIWVLKMPKWEQSIGIAAEIKYAQEVGKTVKYIECDDYSEKDIIAVWFSCGAASAVAAKRTIELYGESFDVRVLNNFILEEDEDNRRFLKDVEKWLGVEIENVKHPKFPSGSAVEVFEKRKFMSSPYGAPCTKILKKEARQIWEKENKPDHTVLGFTVDEKERHNQFILTERDLLPVLVDANITKGDCFKIIQDAGVELPRIYKMGYPNANCIGCVKASSPTYWNHVRVKHPDVFDQRSEQSRRIGAKLVRVKGDRIFLDDLDPDAKGRPMKDMNFECGIFCEEI